MQPGGEHGCKYQGNPPAAGHRGRDRGAPSPSHSSTPFPSTETSSSEEQGSPPATGHLLRDVAGAPSLSSPPALSTEMSSFEEQQKHEHAGEQQQQPAASLPEGPLVEILARVPYSSLCRFKCVSKSWLSLCSATDIRRRSPQTLSGFFHFGFDRLQFRNLSGGGPPMVDPSLPFLRDSYKRITVQQCSSSLLLCRCWKSTSEGDKCDHVVCNPAIEKWTVLPPIVLSDQEDSEFFSLDYRTIFLGFDTAASSHFVVFAPASSFFDESAEVTIYSSETGRWTSVQSEWDSETILVANRECVFLNGTMHLITDRSELATVDAEGKVWRRIEIPGITPSSLDNTIASIGHSQGHLYAWHIDNGHDCQLYVWVLEDYDSGKWTLKHTANVLELFGRQCRKGIKSYWMFAIHPACNLIFLTDGKEMTVSYDMDNQNVHVICTSGEFLSGLPYTPCFAEWRSDGH